MYVCVCMNECMYMCMYACMHVYVLCMYVCMYVYVCMYACVIMFLRVRVRTKHFNKLEQMIPNKNSNLQCMLDEDVIQSLRVTPRSDLLPGFGA